MLYCVLPLFLCFSPFSHSLTLFHSIAGELELLNKTLLLSRSDLHVLLEESSAAEQRLQRANSEVGDVLVLLKEKKDELREVEARRAETQGAMAITGRSKSVDEERARVEDTAERGDTRLEVGRGDTWQGSNHLLEIVRGEAERGVSEQGQRGDEQRCLEAAQSLRALQQAASEEEDRLQALQSLRADRAKSLKCTCMQYKSSPPLFSILFRLLFFSASSPRSCWRLPSREKISHSFPRCSYTLTPLSGS